MSWHDYLRKELNAGMNYQIIQSPWLKKAVPIALTAVAGAGVVGTAVLAAKATPGAIEKKEEAERLKGEPLTTWEAFKAMAPSYGYAAGTGLITLGAIGGLVIDNNRKQAELATIVASGNQIINRVSRKYGLLHDTVKEKHPETIKEFDEKNFDDAWNEYVKGKNRKKVGWCGMTAFPDVEGEDWGVPRMMGIEYGNGLADENGHEIIFFEATPADVVCAFYNLNAYYHHEGLIYVNKLFYLLNLPKTDLGDRLVWDPSVLWDEWESDWIGFHTEDLEMEDNVPQPASCTMICFDIPPLAEGYANGMGIQDCLNPSEPSNLQTV